MASAPPGASRPLQPRAARRIVRPMQAALPSWLLAFTPFDWAALAFLLFAHWLAGWIVTHHPRGWRSAGEMVAEYRLQWMRRAARREARIADVTILVSLRNGASFMASMTTFAIGGAVALIGQIDLLDRVAMGVAGAVEGGRPAQTAKTLILVAILVYAFLKFIWSVRVFGYCLVVMGAMPGDRPDDSEEEIEREAARAAALNRAAAKNFNAGLRAIYFALATLAWYLGPAPFAAATLLTAAMLFRREFASETRAALRFRAFR